MLRLQRLLVDRALRNKPTHSKQATKGLEGMAWTNAGRQPHHRPELPASPYPGLQSGGYYPLPFSRCVRLGWLSLLKRGVGGESLSWSLPTPFYCGKPAIECIKRIELSLPRALRRSILSTAMSSLSGMPIIKPFAKLCPERRWHSGGTVIPREEPPWGRDSPLALLGATKK
jgi:hypothetical protein